jgi:hypothetical protein
MEPLNPVREGYVTNIDKAPEPQGVKPFGVPSAATDTSIPASPPPEVLDALDRAARVMKELDRKNVTVTLDQDVTSGLRVLLRHPGAGVHDISHSALLNLLDGDLALIPGRSLV